MIFCLALLGLRVCPETCPSFALKLKKDHKFSFKGYSGWRWTIQQIICKDHRIENLVVFQTGGFCDLPSAKKTV